MGIFAGSEKEIEIIPILLRYGCPMGNGNYSAAIKNITYRAQTYDAHSNPCIERLEFLKSIGSPFSGTECVDAIVNGDNVNALKWLHENDCPCTPGAYITGIQSKLKKIM
jgi:hypothetical protein